MSEYTVRLAAFGIPDDFIFGRHLPQGLFMNKRGEISNKRTGRTYPEHVVWLEDETAYAEGYGKAFERLFATIRHDEAIFEYYRSASYVELQVWLWIDDDAGVPSLHLEPSHIEFLHTLGAHVDVDIHCVA